MKCSTGEMLWKQVTSFLGTGMLLKSKMWQIFRQARQNPFTNHKELQKAVFQHAAKPGATSTSQEASATLQFSVNLVTSEQVQACGIPETAPSLLKKERRRRYQRSGRPHDWRTRQDPFEGLWDEITTWLLAKPDLTAAGAFRAVSYIACILGAIGRPWSEPYEWVSINCAGAFW
jgi:hypothetical protein